MTKRLGNTLEASSGKKQKLDEDIEALWQNDIDEDALEDCIKYATQACEEDTVRQQNVSHLPIYNAFKTSKDIVCSTQVETASTSKSHTTSDCKLTFGELEIEINRLKQQNEEKEGEITILRNKLKLSQVAVQTENKKTSNEWRERLCAVQKEVDTVKSELEFKDLEIANLKQKLLDITKHAHLDIRQNNTKKTTIREYLKFDREYVIKKEVCINAVYPLRTATTLELFRNLPDERHTMLTNNTNFCRLTIPYLQNQISESQAPSIHKCLSVENKLLNFNYVYSDIFELVNSTAEQLNQGGVSEKINRVLCVTLDLLCDFHDYLVKVGTNLRTEDIQQTDADYLQNKTEETQDFSLSSFNNDEIGLKAGLLLTFIAELLPHNQYLMGFVCHSKPLLFNKADTFTQHFSCIHIAKKNDQFYLLNKLLDTVSLLGKFRKAHLSTVFLCSLVKLLEHISKTDGYHVVKDLFCNLTKEIVFARPQIKVMYYLTFLLKNASTNPSFIEFMFKRTLPVEAHSNKGILYFKDGACCFYIFSVLFYNTIFCLNNLPVIVCINMLSFIYNTIKICPYILHQETKDCECLAQLYKLEIGLMYKAIEKYEDEKTNCPNALSDWSIFFNSSMIPKILSLMSSNNYELTEKSVTVYSQFKQVEGIVANENSYCQMSPTDDEIPSISSSKFLNIDF